MSGMAQGTDILVAVAAIEKQIPCIACLPYRGQHLQWSISAQNLYEDILGNSLVQTVYVSDGKYSISKLFKRNEYIVDNCDRLIVCWNGEKSGGTYATMNYANKMQKPLTMLSY